ncbi:MAG: SMP-30/gluconolactonase/LRE family protein, partial [Armatimonadetes bacterium]|nr:SMP-30/gluconolactonase/LRE family protein [Armatimonadota bacterium]
TFGNPYGLVYTDNGLVVAEGYNQLLRLITRKDGASGATASGWTVRRLAGNGATGRIDGLGYVATFNRPCGVAVDRSGAVYVADVLSHAVRRVVPTNGHLTLGEPDGSAPSEPVRLANPDGLAASTGFGAKTPFVLYAEEVADGATSAARQWALRIPSGVRSFEFTVLVEAATAVPADPQGGTTSLGSPNTYVRTLAGPLTRNAILLDGVGPQARFQSAEGIAVDDHGIAYVADAGSQAIRRVAPDGSVTTIAGLNEVFGSADGNGATATLRFPTGIAVTPDGRTLYVADEISNDIRRLALAAGGDPANPADWTVTTVAGGDQAGYAGGNGGIAQFVSPHGIALDSTGTLYVTEIDGHRVRRIKLAGADPAVAANWYVSVVAGSTGGEDGFNNGTQGNARFRHPAGIDVGPDGDIYVADRDNNSLRRITPGWVVTTFGPPGSLVSPFDVDVDDAGYVFAVCRYAVSRHTPSGGAVAFLAGTTTSSSTASDGTGDLARFHEPRGLALCPNGDILVTDDAGPCVRLVER